MPAEIYTIIVSGESFRFTRDQLESEPGNYFATYFFGGFQEATSGTKELILEKEPLFFKHIQTHLRGYQVFPIPEEFLPPYMDEVTALKNLQSDAEFFGLDQLNTLIELQIQNKALRPSSKSKPQCYRIWSHDMVEGVSDGAPIERRGYTDLTEAAAAKFSSPHPWPLPTCQDCLKITEGWKLEFALAMTNRHYVIEAR